MKTHFLLLAFCLFSFSTTFAIGNPKICTACKYGFSQQGTRFLVGAERAYYGSEKRATKAEFSATPTSADRKLLLQDVYPGMDGVALFWNYDGEGVAHLTELNGSVVVFKRNGSTYAWACENLLEICAYGKEAPPKPAPVYMQPDTIWPEPVIMPDPRNMKPADIGFNRQQVDVYYVEPRQCMRIITAIATYEADGRPGGQDFSHVLRCLTQAEIDSWRVQEGFPRYKPYGGRITQRYLGNPQVGDRCPCE